MQLLIQVLCTKGRSLRQAIVTDSKVILDKFALKVSEHHRAARADGWAKIHSSNPEYHGAINIQWDQSTRLLICRVVTKGSGQPSFIVGCFIAYLLEEHGERVQSIVVTPSSDD
jgi:hypothetical protein